MEKPPKEPGCIRRLAQRIRALFRCDRPRREWVAATSLPSHPGWYLTRENAADTTERWRAWGNGSWWKQIGGGWLSSFDNEGKARLYEWKPASYHDISLNASDLPHAE